MTHNTTADPMYYFFHFERYLAYNFPSIHANVWQRRMWDNAPHNSNLWDALRDARLEQDSRGSATGILADFIETVT